MQWARLVLLLFLVAQVYDGVFTYVAVTAFGHGAEGNFILGTWMDLVGAAPTLLVAKSVAMAGGVVLYTFGVHRVLALLTVYYAVAAIGPWLYLYRTTI